MKPKKAEKVVAKPTFEKETYLMVDPKLIVNDEKKNPRIEYGDIEELMLSIVENGIRNPLKGYEKDGKIILKDGHRRMRAINLALKRGKKIERVPVIVEKRAMNDEERTLEYIIYNDGKPLTMMEHAEVIRRLTNFGWKVTDVVKKTGKTRGYIENLIMLNQAPMKVQHHIQNGKISAHTVIQIMQAVKGDAEKAVMEVEVAIQKAKESGKEKATPKHVEAKKVKGQSYGKFYKWVEEIVDGLAGKKNVIKAREEVISNLLVYFENGQTASQVTERYFLDKNKRLDLTPDPSIQTTKNSKK
jgi:ParB/RepB/Spo0J family partition protein